MTEKRTGLGWIGTTLALVAAFAAGYLLGGAPASAPPAPSGEVRAELEALLALPRGVERTGRFVGVLEGLTEERAEIVAETFEADFSLPSQYEIRLFAGEWAKQAPETALMRALAWKDRAARLSGGGEAIQVWARENPAAARQALAEISEEPSELRGALSTALAIGWIDSGVDPQGLAPYLSGLTEWDRERATRQLIDKLVADRGPEAAMRWAEAIPEDAPFGFRNLAFRKISLVVGVAEPERVAQWLEPHRERRYGQSGFRILGRTWASHDPEAAIAWATSQPDDRARFLSVKFAFERWYEDDKETALAWLRNAPPGALLDPAYLMVALVDGPTDPAGAADAALRIEDDAMRADTLGKVLGPWVQSAPEDAKRWLDASELSQENRAMVLRHMNRAARRMPRARAPKPPGEVTSP